MGIKVEIKEAILGGHLYDFVSNNEHRLSKHELVELVKNLDYTGYSDIKDCVTYKDFCTYVVANLNDIDFFEED